MGSSDDDLARHVQLVAEPADPVPARSDRRLSCLLAASIAGGLVLSLMSCAALGAAWWAYSELETLRARVEALERQGGEAEIGDDGEDLGFIPAAAPDDDFGFIPDP